MEKNIIKKKKGIFIGIILILCIISIRHYIIFNQVVSYYKSSSDIELDIYGNIIENSLYIDQEIDYNEFTSNPFLGDGFLNELAEVSVTTSESIKSTTQEVYRININVVERILDKDGTILVEIKNGKIVKNITDK